MTLRHHTRKLLSIAAISIATLGFIPTVLAQDEPPARVARVGYAYGNINFADAGSNEWVPLLANRPISTGDSVFVSANGRAELQVGANALRLSEQTRISFINLNDDNIQIKLSQGTMVLRVRAMQEKENVEVSTPNLNFSIQEPGEYRINVNDDNTSTIMVRRGIGVAQGDRDIITLREGEQTRFSGTNLNHTQITRVPPFDSFDQWAADRDRAEENSISARYVPREVVGYQQLDDYGNWETHVEYGAIWYPRGITTTWAPYRDGQWVWVAPWGWTWVDRSPWGFAPYHYGRWAFVGKRWGWVPGRYERHYRPVYAPALVAFVGVGSDGISAGISINSRSHAPSVSWFPLGPGEIYRPHYTQNTRYIQNMNRTVIINNTTVINRADQGYRNQHVHNAVTSVPTRTFVRGEHVFPASSSILSGQIRQMRVATEAPNLVPERGNRFGDARPRNWQENDQFRARPVINNANRNEAALAQQVQQPQQIQQPQQVQQNAGQSNGILGGLVNPRNVDNRNQISAPQINGRDGMQRGENRRDTFERNTPPVNVQENSAAMQVPRPVERPSRTIMSDRVNERSVGVERGFERQNERQIERQIERPVERNERRIERNMERVERPQAVPQSMPQSAAMPQMPQVPRVEQRPAPETKREVKTEKEGEKKRFER